MSLHLGGAELNFESSVFASDSGTLCNVCPLDHFSNFLIIFTLQFVAYADRQTEMKCCVVLWRFITTKVL